MRTALALTVAAVSTMLLFEACGSTSGRDAGASGGGGGLGSTGGGIGASGGGVATGGGSVTGGGAAGGRAGGAAGGSAGGAAGGASGGSAGGSAVGPQVFCGGAVCGSSEPTCCGVVEDGGLRLSCRSGDCPDAGPAFSCDSPDDCDADAGVPFCCASLDLAAGPFPNCPTNALSSTCRATCTTTLALSCPSVGTARMCSHSGTDCAAAQKCCAFTQGSATLQLCVSGTLPCTNIP